MSANPDVLRDPDLADLSAQERVPPPATVLGEKATWNPEHFAREQIRGLVRQVFFSSRIPPVKQVVLSAAEPQIDVASICEKVGWALALETSASIAIVGCEHSTPTVEWRDRGRISPVKSRSTHIANNLWRVWGVGSLEGEEEFRSARCWLSGLTELRSEFEYAVIHSPPAGISSEAALLGRLTDGIVLVLGAHSTRRVTARKIKQALEAAEVTILGTVLSERTFPIPAGIYQRL
jgi:hypothetical protein